MSQDKREDDVKKIVKEETEPIERSDAPWQKPERPETPGGFGDLFEDMWSDLEDPQDSKKRMNRRGCCPKGSPSSSLILAGRFWNRPQAQRLDDGS